VVYGVLSSTVLPNNHPVLIAGAGLVFLAACAVALWFLREHHVLERAREWMRPMADSPRALMSRAGLVLLGVTFVLWTCESTVYWTVARSVDVHFSITGALYLVALTNFVAALPAAPGSIGTFDAAVAFGARRLGATGSEAVSYLILLRFVLYVPITLVGFLLLVTRYGGWSRLRQAVRLETKAEAEATRA
jgi:glycosyltransferase 2 family protein